MKNLLSLLFASILLLPFASCNKDEGNDDPNNNTDEPVACIGNDTNKVLLNEEMTFSNCSEFAASYEWDFGDGNTSTDENPKHTFTQKGTYTVTMTAFGEGDVSDETSLEIKVGQYELVKLALYEVDFANKNKLSVSFLQNDGEGMKIAQRDGLKTITPGDFYPVNIVPALPIIGVDFGVIFFDADSQEFFYSMSGSLANMDNEGVIAFTPQAGFGNARVEAFLEFK